MHRAKKNQLKEDKRKFIIEIAYYKEVYYFEIELIKISSSGKCFTAQYTYLIRI